VVGGDVPREKRKMAANNPGSPEENGKSGDQPAAKNHGIPAAINALEAKYEPAQKQQPEHDSGVFLWTRRATMGVFIYTALTFIIAGASIWQGWVARDTEKRQIRAYAFPTPIGINNFSVDSSPTGGVNVRTMGQTPAYKVRGQVGIKPMPYPLSNETDLWISNTKQIQNSTFISPTNTFILKVAVDGTLTRQQVDAINSGNALRLYVWGRVDYEDVFANSHWFTFCYSYDGRSITIDKDGGEPCPRYNDSDYKD
jgi:hypothetical protein